MSKALRLRALRREDDLGARAAVTAEVESPLELVADKGADNREARPAAHVLVDRTVVRDREHRIAVPARKLDPHRVAAMLECVLEQLTEDQRERGRPVARPRPP